jgi:hypothetical protein
MSSNVYIGFILTVLILGVGAGAFTEINETKQVEKFTTCVKEGIDKKVCAMYLPKFKRDQLLKILLKE